MKHFLAVCHKNIVTAAWLFVAFISQSTLASKLIDKTVVTVNNEAILESDVEKFQEKLKSRSFQELFGGVDPKVASNRQNVLTLLVEEKLINQQVKKLELQATEIEVEGQIRAIQKRNEISQSQLTQRLKQLGTTMNEYKDGIRRQIERRNLIDKEIRPSLEVTEDQLRHFYLRNAKAEEADIHYTLAQILVSLRAKGPAAWDDAHTRAKKIHGEVIKRPSEFSALVKEFSDDHDTTETGGQIGVFSLAALAKEFRVAIQKSSVGTITDPIRMADGFHILKVLEIKSGDYDSLSKEKKEAVRGQMVSQEVEKKMTLWIERKKRESNIRRTGGTDANE